MKNKSNWAIIGCGDVAEVKSGPAFQKADDSSLLAVMRRDAAKAEDFAIRHHVPSWYTTVQEVLDRKDIDSVYIATPPSSHMDLAIRALDAGKNVYLEKPMTRNAAEGRIMQDVLKRSPGKMTIAHYRRRLPLFQKVKELLDSQCIGDVRFVQIRFFTSSTSVVSAEDNWRLNPEISGGGLFHDLGPHMLDLMLYFFGHPLESGGRSSNLGRASTADDYVSGEMIFPGGIQFQGLWCFGMTRDEDALDRCDIIGTEGRISFSFFSHEGEFSYGGKTENRHFKNHENIQFPMIADTVKYFQGRGENPCSLEEGIRCMEILDAFTSSESLANS